jgi:hypothetical protein
MGDSGGNFSSINQSVEIRSLICNSIWCGYWAIAFKKFIPESISRSENLCDLDLY